MRESHFFAKVISTLRSPGLRFSAFSQALHSLRSSLWCSLCRQACVGCSWIAAVRVARVTSLRNSESVARRLLNSSLSSCSVPVKLSVMFTATRLLANSRSGLAPLRLRTLAASAAASAPPRRAFSVTAQRAFHAAQAHNEASSVSRKPASDSAKDFAKNAVEEGQGAAFTQRHSLFLPSRNAFSSTKRRSPQLRS